MKIKNVIFENKQYFETIGKIHKSDQLSVMDAYRINRLVKKLNELNTEYDELKKNLHSIWNARRRRGNCPSRARKS